MTFDMGTADNSITDFDLDLLLGSAPTSISENNRSTNSDKNSNEDQNLGTTNTTEEVWGVHNGGNTESTVQKHQEPNIIQYDQVQNMDYIDHEMVRKSEYDTLLKQFTARNKDYDILKKQFAKLGLDYAALHEENKSNALTAMTASTKYEKLEAEIKEYRDKLNFFDNQHSEVDTLRQAQSITIAQYSSFVQTLQKDVDQLKKEVNSEKKLQKDARKTISNLNNRNKILEEHLCHFASVIEKRYPVDMETQRLIKKYLKKKLEDLESIENQSIDTGRGSSFTSYSPAYSINFSPLSTGTFSSQNEQKMMKDASSSPPPTIQTFDISTSPIMFEVRTEQIENNSTSTTPILNPITQLNTAIAHSSDITTSVNKMQTSENVTSPISFCNTNSLDVATSPIHMSSKGTLVWKTTYSEIATSPIGFSDIHSPITKAMSNIACSPVNFEDMECPVAHSKLLGTDYNVPNTPSPGPMSPTWDINTSPIEYTSLDSAIETSQVDLTRPLESPTVPIPIKVKTPEKTKPLKPDVKISPVVRTPDITSLLESSPVPSPAVKTPEISRPLKPDVKTSPVVQTPDISRPLESSAVPSPAVKTPDITRPFRPAIKTCQMVPTPDITKLLEPSAVQSQSVHTLDEIGLIEPTSMMKPTVKSVVARLSDKTRPIGSTDIINILAKTTRSEEARMPVTDTTSVLSTIPDLTSFKDAANLRRAVVHTPSSRLIKYADIKSPLATTKNPDKIIECSSQNTFIKKLKENQYQQTLIAQEDEEDKRNDLEISMILNKFSLDLEILSPLPSSPDLDKEELVQSDTSIRNNVTETQNNQSSRQISKESDSLFEIIQYVSGDEHSGCEIDRDDDLFIREPISTVILDNVKNTQENAAPAYVTPIVTDILDNVKNTQENAAPAYVSPIVTNILDIVKDTQENAVPAYVTPIVTDILDNVKNTQVNAVPAYVTPIVTDILDIIKDTQENAAPANVTPIVTDILDNVKNTQENAAPANVTPIVTDILDNVKNTQENAAPAYVTPIVTNILDIVKNTQENSAPAYVTPIVTDILDNVKNTQENAAPAYVTPIVTDILDNVKNTQENAVPAYVTPIVTDILDTVKNTQENAAPAYVTPIVTDILDNVKNTQENAAPAYVTPIVTDILDNVKNTQENAAPAFGTPIVTDILDTVKNTQENAAPAYVTPTLDNVTPTTDNVTPMPDNVTYNPQVQNTNEMPVKSTKRKSKKLKRRQPILNANKQHEDIPPPMEATKPHSISSMRYSQNELRLSQLDKTILERNREAAVKIYKESMKCDVKIPKSGPPNASSLKLQPQRNRHSINFHSNSNNRVEDSNTESLSNSSRYQITKTQEPMTKEHLSKETQLRISQPQKQQESKSIISTILATKSSKTTQQKLQSNKNEKNKCTSVTQLNLYHFPIQTNPEYGRKRTICRSIESQLDNKHDSPKSQISSISESNSSKSSAVICSEGDSTSYSKTNKERISRVKLSVLSKSISIPNIQSQNIDEKNITVTETNNNDNDYTPLLKKPKASDDGTVSIKNTRCDITEDNASKQREATKVHKNNNSKILINEKSTNNDDPSLNVNLRSTITSSRIDENDKSIPETKLPPNERKRSYTDYNDISMFKTHNDHLKKPRTNNNGLTDEWRYNLLDRMIYLYGSNPNNKKVAICKTKCDEHVAKKIENAVAKCVNTSEDLDKYNKALQEVTADLQKQGLQKLIGGFLKYLRNTERRGQFVPGNKNRNYHSIPTPTKYVMSLIDIIDRIDKNGLNIWQLVLDTCEYILFTLDKEASPSIEVVESVTHLFVNMSRFRNSSSKLWIFMLNAMYCATFKAILIIKHCLDLVPNILPHENKKKEIYPGLAPLLRCIVFLIHFYNSDDPYKKVQDLRFTLKRRYAFDITDENETTILFTLKQAIININDNYFEKKMLELTLLILAKRKGTQWCHKNIVQKILLPIIKGKISVSNAAFRLCLTVIGELLKPYKNEMTIHCEEVVSLLINIFEQPQPDEIKEDIICSLIHMNMKYVSDRINKCLLNWNPPNISPHFEEALRLYIQRRPIKNWMFVHQNINGDRSKSQ